MNYNMEQKLSKTQLLSSTFNTILGDMLAIADDQGLYLLEFTDKKLLNYEVQKLEQVLHTKIIKGNNLHLTSIEKEIQEYFAGKLSEFSTKLHLLGTDFQKSVWQQLLKIPYGETESYLMQAKAIGKAKSFRAVANTNGRNRLAIIIPCHRVINSNGKLGGYAGGVSRKSWLIEHEKQNKSLMIQKEIK